MTATAPDHRIDGFVETMGMGAHGAALHLRDVEGRPLGERSAPPEMVAQLQFDDRVSAFPTREGLLMNTAALRQVMGSWGEAMKIISAIRKVYGSSMQVEHLAVNDLWNVSRIITSLPAYLAFRRHDATKDGDFSLPQAASYKMGGGPFLTAAKLIGARTESGENIFTSHVSAGEFFDMTVEAGVFNLRGATCAASPKLVQTFLEALITPGNKSSSDDLAAVDVGFYRYAVDAVIGDFYKIIFAAKLSYLKEVAFGYPNFGQADGALLDRYRKVGWLYGIGRSLSAPVSTPNERVEKLARLQRIIEDSEQEVLRLSRFGGLCAVRAELTPMREQKQLNAEVVNFDQVLMHSHEQETLARETLTAQQIRINSSLGWSSLDPPPNFVEASCETRLVTNIYRDYSHHRT